MSSHPSSSALALDIVLLRTFLAVVDLRGFAAAADRLTLTPSAVSGHIKRLEESLGTRLLPRTTRQLDMTSAGETLYTYARNILDLEQEVRARLRGESPAGRLVIGASEDFAGTWLAQVLQVFRRGHPGIAIELRVGITTELLRQQAEGELDVVFGKRCARIEDDSELLWEEPLVWAFAEHTVLPSDEPVPLSVFPEPCVYRESAINALAAADIDWRLAFESRSMAGCLAAAQAGFAVSPVAQSQLRQGLRAVDESEGLPPLAMARFHAFTGKPAPMTRALVEAVREVGRRRRFASD
ncbi:LysR substrate-binding domain-containing protein [Pseudomonas sp. RW3S2]|uniref:LysR substrate-binding domain-containing protein n=1 Tax=Pseudomonas sp. RW3S2 TaxID=485884 RepID=UPI001645DA91|nr:LysR substrate-binding domain-containing protein [Pseudomonas sp. RW3S2]MBC3423727.1 LysR family transcriptional regulator [Pseudomonas sp. RW3S2]